MRTSKLKFTSLTDQLGKAAEMPDTVNEVETCVWLSLCGLGWVI